jgi:hypothetical protein
MRPKQAFSITGVRREGGLALFPAKIEPIVEKRQNERFAVR